MNKLLVVTNALLMCFQWSFSFANANDLKEERMKILQDLGLPLPGSGIKLVPRSMMGLPPDVIKEGEKSLREIKTLGYAIDKGPRAQELLSFRSRAQYEFKTLKNNESITSTHIRRNRNQVKLAFNQSPSYKNIAHFREINTIGYVPFGSFQKKEDGLSDKTGWSGIVQFFDVKSIGTCAYSLKSVKASHTAAELALEDVTYAINSKATLTHTKGFPGSGFVYLVEWYDDQYFQELECANEKFSNEIKDSVINLAKKIDSNLS